MRVHPCVVQHQIGLKVRKHSGQVVRYRRQVLLIAQAVGKSDVKVTALNAAACWENSLTRLQGRPIRRCVAKKKIEHKQRKQNSYFLC